MFIKMAPQYKLTYFNNRALAEVSRLIFAYAGVDYEDVRLEKGAQWEEFKSKTPFGKLPMLEFDGVVLSQSKAIARYLAQQYGLVGKTPLDSAKCDMFVDGLFDLFLSLGKWFIEQDAAKKAELLDEFLKTTLATYLNGVEKCLRSSEYLVGNSLTWADLAVADTLSTYVSLSPTVLGTYPLLNSFRDRILNIPKIKEWIDKRPVTLL